MCDVPLLVELDKPALHDPGSVLLSAIPSLQMSFETTTEFMAKAAVARSSDKLKSPSARIVMGRVGDFGTGMFDLRQPAEFAGVGGVGVAVGGDG